MLNFARSVLVLLMFLLLSFNLEAGMKELSKKDELIVKISALTSSGKTDELKSVFEEALNNKMSINEINEILIQSYAYCGFPRSLNGISVFMETVKARKSKGTKDIQGEMAKILPCNKKSETGEKIREQLAGGKVQGEWQTFAPGIEQYLKEHLFGDIFYRGILTYKEREMATISMLSAMNGVNSQLKSHLSMGKNAGLTDKEIEGISLIIKQVMGEEYYKNMQSVIKSMK